ncbi:MAG: adenylyl-sulfate kinase [Burkholderiaceae bacterium]
MWQASAIRRDQREKKNGHRGVVVWITGLPGSGKTTIAHTVEQNLYQFGMQTLVLDGDNIRHGLCADLGFSVSDRNENVRRTSEVAKLFLEQGIVVLVALVSPIRSAREKVRELIPADDFFEIYCKCPLSVCKERDPKGLYAKVESGTIHEFTGISSPYEEPLNPALTLDTADESVEESANKLSEFLLTQLGYHSK